MPRGEAACGDGRGAREGPAPLPGRARPEGAQRRASAPFASTAAATQHQAAKGYDRCFSNCFLFDFLILVFSEKALASSNSFLRVAGDKGTCEPAAPRTRAGWWGSYCRSGPAARSRDPGVLPGPAGTASHASGLSLRPPPHLPPPPPELVLGFP